METLTTYVGLDVHKETISVAVAESGDRGPARYFGKIANSAQALSKLAAKLSRKGRRLRFCYEAGPCGYGVHLRRGNQSESVASIKMRMPRGGNAGRA